MLRMFLGPIFLMSTVINDYNDNDDHDDKNRTFTPYKSTVINECNDNNDQDDKNRTLHTT